MFGDAVHFSTDNENGPKIVIGVAALRKLERREGGGRDWFLWGYVRREKGKRKLHFVFTMCYFTDGVDTFIEMNRKWLEDMMF